MRLSPAMHESVEHFLSDVYKKSNDAHRYRNYKHKYNNDAYKIVIYKK